MALRTPPSWQQNASHPAENDRLSTQGLWRTTGILGASDLAVTANGTPNMSVNVALGWAAIVGDYATNMGAYVAYNDATQNLVITAASGSNPRIDRIVATVSDSYYTGSLNQVAFQVVAGTPAASPAAPAIPTNSISLATVLVGTSVTSIVSGNITDTRSLSSTSFVTLSGTDTLTNKTLTSPVINDPKLNLSLNAQTGTTYTFVLADNGKLVTASNASAQTYSIPTNATAAFAIGTQINLIQIGAGQVTVNAVTSGTTTVLSNAAAPAAPKCRNQYASLTCIKVATDTWYVIGDIA
jgi:hypothetical protein